MDIDPLEVSDDSPAAGPQPPANSQAHSCPAALTGEVIQKYSKKTHWKGGQEAEVDFEELGDHEGNEMGTWINFHGRSMPLAHLVNSKWWLHMIVSLFSDPVDLADSLLERLVQYTSHGDPPAHDGAAPSMAAERSSPGHQMLPRALQRLSPWRRYGCGQDTDGHTHDVPCQG